MCVQAGQERAEEAIGVAIGFNSKRASKPESMMVPGRLEMDGFQAMVRGYRPAGDVIWYGGRHPPICIQCHRSVEIITALTNCRGEGRSR